MIFESPIAISLSPNTQKDDIWQALKIILQPWRWKSGDSIAQVEEWFNKYFGVSNCVFFNSGRASLYAVLKTFDIGKGDEVIIQAFTCVAVSDPIIWAGAKPIYVDIDDSLNVNPNLLEKAINSKTKAIIVQHTFGIPAKIELIKKITQKFNLILIEDCAHSLGAEVDGKKIGTFGDGAIFSFGRDKVISSVFGGMAIISSKFKVQSSKLRNFQGQLKFPSYFWIMQQLLHPIAFAIILPIYNLLIGKLLLAVLIKLHLLTKPVYKEELLGDKPDIFPAKYPNALALLLLNQLNKLDYYNKIRKKLAEYYFDKLKEIKYIQLPAQVNGAIYLRFNVMTPTAHKILVKAKRQGILLGNWYKNVIDPRGVVYERIGYQQDSCSKAEKAAELSLNLPTYPKLKLEDLDVIINLVSQTQ